VHLYLAKWADEVQRTSREWKGRDRFVPWNGSIDAGCPCIIMNLSLPGMESGLPDPPGGRRNNGKRAYYYFIIAHICRNAYLPLHYRGHLRCELLRLVTGTLLYISDTSLRSVQSNEIQNRR